ncbi:hypothetical protein [Natrinema thermotolerans]
MTDMDELRDAISDRYYERGKMVESKDGAKMRCVGEWTTPSYHDGSVMISIKSALEYLECAASAKAVEFACVGDCDILGRIRRKKMDGRVHEMARNIQRQGGDYRVTLPPKAVTHIPYTTGEIQEREVDLDVWAIDDPEVVAPCIKISPHMVVEAEFSVPADFSLPSEDTEEETKDPHSTSLGDFA